MECLACGTANDPGRRFCRECGSALSVRCPACSGSNVPGDRFCGDCGAALTSAGASRQPEPVASPAATTERRLVSVVFVDLVGFTSFSEGRDPEDVRATLDRYFAAASDAVTRHGGRVEKFIGDAVMAVWGTPKAHEDDAERAVRTAMDVVDRVAALGRELELPLRARAGVVTGEAVATVGAVDQGLVTGDLVNTASRVQSAAEPGTVLVGEGAFRGAAAAIAFEQLEPVVVKGKAEPVPVWRALRVVGERGGSNRLESVEPPFTGRDEELRSVKEVLHAVGREGQERLLFVTGVAGIGKSRLVWELQKYTDGLTESIYWHQGRCPNYGEGIAFKALAEMVRYRAGIAETEDAAATVAKLEACLEEFVADADERAWMLPRLAYLLGSGPAPAGDREETFGAWRRLFERIAEQGTTVLVFEDVHWADAGLLDFVDSLLEWSRALPILVLALARPELLEHRPDWGTGARSSTRISLGRMADSDVRQMVTGYVTGLARETVDRLVERAEGVPLYAVEMVRMLADRGALEPTEHGYKVVGEVDQVLDIPESLQSLVAARLDSLDELDRSLLQDAAVIGVAFTQQMLAAVSGMEAATVEGRLRHLVRREFLERDLDPRSPERGQYRFVQSAIREVAYSTLSKPGRRSRHLACAAWLESLDEDELVGAIGTHCLEALRAEPSAPDAEELAARVTSALLKAADRAMALGSPVQAIEHVKGALPLAQDPSLRARLLRLQGRATSFAGDAADAFSLGFAAADQYEAAGDVRSAGATLSELARVFSTDESREVLEDRLLQIAEQIGGSVSRELALVLASLTDLANNSGRAEVALERSDAAMRAAEAANDPEALGNAGFARSWALFNVGRGWESRAIASALVELARQSGSTVSLARSYLGLSVSCASSDPWAAVDYARECARLAEKIGLIPMQTMALANAAEALVDLGDFAQAESAVRTVTEELVTRDSFDLAGTLLSEAMLAGYLGDRDRAAATLARAARVMGSRSKEVQLLTWVHRARAELALIAGDPASGLGEARASLALDAYGANAPSSLWVGIRCAGVLRDPDALGELLERGAGLRGAWVERIRLAGRLLADGLTGDPAAAEGLEAVAGDLREDRQNLAHVFLVGVARAALGPDFAPAEVQRAREFVGALPGRGVSDWFETQLSRRD